MASIGDQSESSAYQKQGKVQNKKAPKREPVSIAELCVGCIVWMPEQEGAESARCIMPHCPCNRSELDENGSEHHLVVLDVFKTNNGDVRCHVGKVTSKVSKAKNFTARIKIHQGPAASSTEQRDLDDGLYLETGELRKQSHVSLGHVYEVSPSLFSTKKGVPAYDRRLSEQSYYHLMKAMGIPAAKYERTRDVVQNGATTRTWIAGTQANFYHETLEARVVDLPNGASSIGTAQRMAAFQNHIRPAPLNSQRRPTSPPEDSPTSQSGVSTASGQSLDENPIYGSPNYGSPNYEQHSPHGRPIPSRQGSIHSLMTHSSHAASTTTMHSSLISPGHDTRFTKFDADAAAAARQQDASIQRARDEADAAAEREQENKRKEYERRQRELAEIEYQHQQQELADRIQEEKAKIEQIRLQEKARREQIRLQEEAQRERIHRNLKALDEEEKRRKDEALRKQQLRLRAEIADTERQRQSIASLEEEHRIRREQRRRSRESVSTVSTASTERVLRTEAARATQHYLGKIAVMEQEHPPQKEYLPQMEPAPLGREYLRRGAAPSEREQARRPESTRQSDIGNGSTATSGTYSSSYSKYTKYTQISEYTSTRITKYTRYTTEVVMHGVENAPWRAMSVGSVVVVGCYTYYSGSYETGFEAAKGLAGGLRAVAGMAGRVLKSLTRLRR
ncbi:predicted protein [Sclerotinia sclerotiorum 1980 UF-70]|uniref:Uncharacterized protein n=2 Tax=Sclerotinia sclerotiorum (strain ATCC 18683 / 1980 / Ss-1) TaxID=665079 RepID=A7EAJ4_SCLS1|nr:predicted protein [Sclerotinia sclerotiorum 1980 UF-70]APA08607.1 hypothetical protein sscle_04g033770 [Sclerotinia sclerotiorum 1980 UF-70]EDN99472.1 predicted protein [Sclerotinia sclerotiorum 1980 UF-70]